MKVGLVGESAAGKTTLFSALTGIDLQRILAMSGKEVSASVPVIEPRLRVIHEREGKHKKLVSPSIEIHDSPALRWEQGVCTMERQEDLAALRDMDGLILVLKAYDLPEMSPEERKKKVAATLDQIHSGLLMTDLDIMQKRIEKLKEQAKRPGKNTEADQKEREILERLQERVAGGDTTVFASLTEEDEKKSRGFKFFSRKPLLTLVNVADRELQKEDTFGTEGEAGYLGRCCATLELELSQMPEEERKEFMEGYGLKSLFVANLAVKVYDALGWHMFFTLGKNDTTGWGLRKGTRAREAAGKIHSDIEKGFINAEVISYEQWLASGKHAPHRIEGKDYVVRSGDILNFKFNV